MSEQFRLNYHWSNPKFEGEPWPAEQKPKSKCVRVIYSKDEAQRRVWKLQFEESGYDWKCCICHECQAWHVIRMRPVTSCRGPNQSDKDCKD